jgi:hypothetical protein
VTLSNATEAYGTSAVANVRGQSDNGSNHPANWKPKAAKINKERRKRRRHRRCRGRSPSRGLLRLNFDRTKSPASSSVPTGQTHPQNARPNRSVNATVANAGQKAAIIARLAAVAVSARSGENRGIRS